MIFLLFLCIFTTIFVTKNQKKKECRTLCYFLLLKKIWGLQELELHQNFRPELEPHQNDSTPELCFIALGRIRIRFFSEVGSGKNGLSDNC
jgi:hypothetical protein